MVALSSPPAVNGRKQVKEAGSPVKIAGSILTLSLGIVRLIMLSINTQLMKSHCPFILQVGAETVYLNVPFIISITSG